MSTKMYSSTHLKTPLGTESPSPYERQLEQFLRIYILYRDFYYGHHIPIIFWQDFKYPKLTLINR